MPTLQHGRSTTQVLNPAAPTDVERVLAGLSGRSFDRCAARSSARSLQTRLTLLKNKLPILQGVALSDSVLDLLK